MTPADEMSRSRCGTDALRDNQSPPSAAVIASLRKKSASGAPPSPPPVASIPQSLSANSLMAQQGSGSFSGNDLKVAVLGFNGVGKTAFIVRFLTRRFIGEYCRGIEAKYKCSLSVDGEIIRLEILDSSLPTIIGSDRNDRKGGSSNVFFRLNENLIEWADAFILVYAITSHRSFQVIREIRKQICEQYASMDKISKKPVMMLLGNKADLEHFREIDSKTAEAYADQKNDLVFYELSTANSPDDVQRCMYAFIRLVRVRMLTSVAAASMVQHQHQHQHQQQQQQQIQHAQKQHHHSNTQHAQRQQQQQQIHQQPVVLSNANESSSSGAVATSMMINPTGASSAGSATDGGKQSAKAFLLNKMFGGMMKQAKQASVLATSGVSSNSGRRSGDSSSGLVLSQTAAPATFSD